MQELVMAARAASLPFEVSADGTFVRFERKGEPVYVVRNAWRGGYTVLVMSGEGKTQIGHYAGAEEAVAAAVGLVARGRAYNSSTAYEDCTKRLAS